MSSAEISTLAAPSTQRAIKVWRQGAVTVTAWVAVALLISYWPNAARTWPMTQGLANLCLAVAALIGLLGVVGHWSAKVATRIRSAGAWSVRYPAPSKTSCQRTAGCPAPTLIATTSSTC